MLIPDDLETPGGGGYWPLQWYELAIFLAAAVALAGVCLWRVRRIG